MVAALVNYSYASPLRRATAQFFDQLTEGADLVECPVDFLLGEGRIVLSVAEGQFECPLSILN